MDPTEITEQILTLKNLIKRKAWRIKNLRSRNLKLLRDARLFRIYEGTSEVQRYIVSGYAMNGYQPVMPALEDLPIHREKDPAEFDDKENAPAWRCRICGYVHYADEPPDECPYCFFPQSAFKKV